MSPTNQTASKKAPLIYLVDDEPLLLDLAESTLGPSGYKMKKFLDPEAALESFMEARSKPSLIITDYSMGKMNGLELVEKCRAVKPDLKIILISGTAGAGDCPRLRSEGGPLRRQTLPTRESRGTGASRPRPGRSRLRFPTRAAHRPSRTRWISRREKQAYSFPLPPARPRLPPASKPPPPPSPTDRACSLTASTMRFRESATPGFKRFGGKVSFSTPAHTARIDVESPSTISRPSLVSASSATSFPARMNFGVSEARSNETDRARHHRKRSSQIWTHRRSRSHRRGVEHARAARGDALPEGKRSRSISNEPRRSGRWCSPQ
ncbi:MAG: response regulator [Verrucomicrobia bacterium]|nr:response regulator [Verrucomicrobiota bacterium]